MSMVPDPVFAALRAEPVPPSLAAISAGVMSGLEAGRARRALRRAAVLGCLAAGLIGVGFGVAGEPAAAPEPAGLLAMPVSAPSHLLAA